MTRYRIELEAMPDSGHPDARIKRLLKFALRVLRLRCKHCSVVEVE